MRFWVNVPVLSVQITVAAPIVSQACILRTKLFVFSIRFMLSAKLNVTLIGSPSGTDTTINVTATMKLFNICEISVSVEKSAAEIINFTSNARNVNPAAV